jgi:hypothetical protein
MNQSKSQAKRLAVQGTLVGNLTSLVKALAGPEMRLPPASIPTFNHLYQELTRIDERRSSR